MARKMHCTLKEIGNDSPKLSEAGKDSISTIHRQQNKLTSLKDCEESSLSRINSDSRCAILSFLNFEPDGNWRIVALPVRCLNHIKLASGVNMDGLQLVFPPSLNMLKIDQHKGPRGPLPDYAYSVESFTGRSINGSNVRHRCQNKIAKKASKLNVLPGNSCSRTSLACSNPSGLFPDVSVAVNSSDMFLSNSKADKSVKKKSRKRARKKGKQSKNQSNDSGFTEREVLTEEYVSVSLTSETCSSNDVDKEVGLISHTTGPEFSSSDDGLIKNDCERNKMNGGVNLTETPKSCNSYIDEEDLSKATAPMVEKSAGESATCNSKNQLQNRGPDFAVIDRETKDIQHIELCCYNDIYSKDSFDIHDSLVLDSVSVGSNSDESTNAGDIGKQSNKASFRITSNSGDGYFLGQNLLNGIHNNCEHNEGTRHGGQNCITNDKRVKQKRTASTSSSFNKFGGVGILHGRTGKENSHSVWQKVQKNSSGDCGGDLKKVNKTMSQFNSTVKRDSSVIRNCNSVDVNVLSTTEDKNQLKNKVGKKSKVKLDPVSKKGHCSYPRKRSNFKRCMINDNAKVSDQQNGMSHVSSKENNEQGLSSVSGCHSDINCPKAGLQIKRVEHITSALVHSAQVQLEESDPQKSACHTNSTMKDDNIDSQDSSLTVPCEHITQSNMSDEQSQVSLNLLGDEVGQTQKEVSSADFSAQNHSSGSTLWKWIPIGKKDTGLAISDSDSSSLEHSDVLPSKKFNSDISVEPEPKVASFSQNHVSSLNESRTYIGQNYSNFSCLDEDENKKLGNQVACTLTVRREKHEAANHMIYECENQDTSENGSSRIAQAVNDACRAQLACEAVKMATGGPIAEFERLLHFCSPVISQSPNSHSCLTCSLDDAGGVPICRNEMPDLSLGRLWQWYEKPGSYGLEIRAQQYENPKRLDGVGHFPFRAYFVPSLSAVQLFKNHENQSINSCDKFPNCKVSKACEMIDTSEHSSTAGRHPIFSVLFPRPCNQDASIQTPKKTSSINSSAKDNASTPPINSCSGDLELLFEYFESDQPQQRQPLYEKIQELVRGNIPIQSKIYGDPTTLDTVDLRDLHPRSWYSVAWYPIYRIPDGNLRAAFLTYHSLGHLVRRSTKSSLPTVGSCIVSPVVGLQSYNAQGECWFQLRHSALTVESLGLNPYVLLKERLRTLEETASLMARAVVNKGNLLFTNRHPDYEFFLSRRRY